MVRGQIRNGKESDTPERQIAAFRKAGFSRYETIYAVSSRGRAIGGRHHYQTVTPVYVFSKGRPDTVNLPH